MNYRLLIQYDGTRYYGWQRQNSTDATIQGKIEVVLSRLEGRPVEIHGAGRTDAGVHALGQVANVHLTERPAEEIRNYLNRYLPEDIGIIEVKQVSERFHSRLNASEKIYVYRLATDPALHVFERKYMTPCEEPLDLDAMKEAAAYLVGEHDFQSFCTKKMKKSSVRKLEEIRLEQLLGEIRITYRGNGFLYNMVRILTGTLLEVGIGKLSPEDIPAILEAKERQKAGATAPAQGLCLKEVRY